MSVARTHKHIVLERVTCVLLARHKLPRMTRKCSAQGLWAGAYGPHGLEIVCVLQVKHAAAHPRDALACPHARIQAHDRKFAVKVTGDNNVPAGEVTFVIPTLPLLPRSPTVPCGCRNMLVGGDEEACSCPPLWARAKCFSGMQCVAGSWCVWLHSTCSVELCGASCALPTACCCSTRLGPVSQTRLSAARVR